MCGRYKVAVSTLVVTSNLLELGLEGPAGPTGPGGGSDTVVNSQIRYTAYNSGTQNVQIMSTGTLFGNKTWSRTGTTVTVTATAHGLTAGDYIVVRGGSDTYLYVAISNVSTNAFDFTSGTSGTSSGSDLAYIPAFKATSFSDTAGTVQVASAGNCQLNSIAMTTGTATGATFVLSVPDSITNGAGDNQSLITENPPIVQCWKLDTGGFNASGTVSVNTSAPFNRFTVGGIATFINNAIRFQF